MRCINKLDLIWFDLYHSLSRDIVGRVSPDHLSQFHLKDVSTFFPPGKLITVHVLRCVSPYIEPLDLGVVHNYQHYQKRTQSTLLCDSLPPSLLKEYFENVDFCDPLMKMQCIIINIKKAYQPWPPPPVYSVYSRENDDNYGLISHKTFYLLTFDWCLAFYFFHPHLFSSFFLMFLTVLFPLLWWSIFHVIRLQAAQSCVCSLDNPFSVKSCLKLSIHFRFGHSLLLPVDITVTLLFTHSSSLHVACWYHFNLLSKSFFDISPTFFVPLTLSPFSPFLTISLCRAGHYLSHPVFPILCHVFSQLVFLHVSLYVVPPILFRSASAPSPRNFQS